MPLNRYFRLRSVRCMPPSRWTPEAFSSSRRSWTARHNARRPWSVAATAAGGRGCGAGGGSGRQGRRRAATSPGLRRAACAPVAQVRRAMTSGWPKSAGETRALRFFENAANCDQGVRISRHRAARRFRPGPGAPRSGAEMRRGCRWTAVARASLGRFPKTSPERRGFHQRRPYTCSYSHRRRK